MLLCYNPHKMKNLELNDTVLYEGEQYQITEIDEENEIYGLSNENEETFVYFNQVTPVI